MISKKPSIQYLWEFPLTIKTNTIKQSGRITFWSKGKNRYQHNGHTVGVGRSVKSRTFRDLNLI